MIKQCEFKVNLFEMSKKCKKGRKCELGILISFVRNVAVCTQGCNIGAEEQELFANTRSIYEERVALAILYRQMGTDLQLLLHSKHSQSFEFNVSYVSIY